MVGQAGSSAGIQHKEWKLHDELASVLKYVWHAWRGMDLAYEAVIVHGTEQRR